MRFLVAAIVGLLLIGCTSTMETQTLTLKSQTITVEVVRTPEQMSQGLSGRDRLNMDQGMLFLYDQPARPNFWMKGMNFPIDIVWLRGGQVVGIEHRVPVDDGARHYQPSSDVDAVLELAADAADSMAIREGDHIIYRR